MTWVKLDDAFYDNLTNRALGPGGRDLFCAGLAFCAKGLTDGRIPKDDVTLVLAQAQAKPALVKRLLEVGRWIDRGDHYEVDGYLAYNPTKAKVLADRERERLKKASQRQAGSAAVGRGEEGRYVPRGTPRRDKAGDTPEGVPSGCPPLPVPSRPPDVDPSAAATTSRGDRLAAAAGIIGERASHRPGVQSPARVRMAVARTVTSERLREAYAWLDAHPDGTAEQLADHLEPPDRPAGPVLPPTSAPEAIADFGPAATKAIPDHTRQEGLASVRALRNPPDPAA